MTNMAPSKKVFKDVCTEFKGIVDKSEDFVSYPKKNPTGVFYYFTSSPFEENANMYYKLQHASNKTNGAVQIKIIIGENRSKNLYERVEYVTLPDKFKLKTNNTNYEIQLKDPILLPANTASKKYKEFAEKILQEVVILKNKVESKIKALNSMSQTDNNIDNIIKVLEYKKQIILQGPPGTGKTYTAKDIAEKIICASVTANKIVQMTNLKKSGKFELVQFHPSYTYEDFVRGITAKVIEGQIAYETENKILLEFAQKAIEDPENKYVLLIDEINRANLPSVLGELIYALEYRRDTVNSMYALNGDASIVIPDNLYIIGTMNTADRSVGHIDYAIKRRFAFIDVPPNKEVINNEDGKKLFDKVAKLFVTEDKVTKDKVTKDKVTKVNKNSEYLAPDFDYKDVQLGHSYFIATDDDQLKIKLEYEIKPILREYVKDGLLLEAASAEIDNLKIQDIVT